MDIALSEEQAALVRMRVESGKNASEQEVIDDALRLLLEDEILASADQEELKATLRRARAQLDRGEGVEWNLDKFLTEAEARRAQRLKGAHA